jgi:outer membrane biosynthesis protein TonB
MTGTEFPDEHPIGEFVAAARDFALEVVGLVPRLAERTAEQVSLLAALRERLGCLNDRSGGVSRQEDTSARPPQLSVLTGGATSTADSEAEAATVQTVTASATAEPTKPAAAKQASVQQAPAKKSATKQTTANKPTKKQSAAKKTAAKSVVKKAPAKKTPAKKAPAKKTSAKQAPVQAPTKKSVAAPPVATTPLSGELAIAGYDTLAASQIIDRLDTLNPAELDAIGRYETANRGRRTILGKLSQLAE